MKANQAAFEVGKLAERLFQGYYTHTAAIQIATDPRVELLLPSIPVGQIVPIGYVPGKRGTQQHIFHFAHYLDHAKTNPAIVAELPRVWLIGSLLTMGDALTKHRYFDHAPELELLFHLRNGVAHGNVFHFIRGGLSRLGKHPAHNRLAWTKTSTMFEISAGLEGQTVLFDFMGPADILDLLQAISVYLIRMGNGDPLRP